MNNVEGKIPGYNYAQNFWQMSGGPDGSPEMRVWNNSDEQKKRLSTLLTENIKREYANETNKTNYNITNKEYNNEQEQESTAILTEGLLLDAEISESVLGISVTEVPILFFNCCLYPWTRSEPA